MRKTTPFALQFVLCFSLLGGLAPLAIAQQETDERGQIHVKVTERNGKDTRVIERTYRGDGMTDEKRDALINKLIDSLQAARTGKGSTSISVIVEDSYRGPARNGRRNRMVEDRYIDGYALVTPPTPPVPPTPPTGALPPITPGFDMQFHYYDDNDNGDTSRSGRRTREFRLQRRQLDSVSSAMRRKSRDLERSLRPMADRLNRNFQNFDWQRDLARPFNNWVGEGGQTSTVRGLDVYPNNPDRNLLNVRFSAPAKGDVQIVVTNTKGKEVARRELKDFSGEFVGQVDVGRNATGVFFVTVTQNEDGSVRRVVLRKEESTK